MTMAHSLRILGVLFAWWGIKGSMGEQLPTLQILIHVPPFLAFKNMKLVVNLVEN